MKNLIFLISTIIMFSACKKGYTCECDNPGGHEVFIIHDTKSNAEKECFKYRDIPWSETSCTLK